MANWPQVSMIVPEGYSRCFGCGQENPIGLKLKFQAEGTEVKATFVPDERFQGWPGYLHGGITGCLLDEAMSWAAVQAGVRCVTAEFDVKLKRLIPIKGPLTITGAITRKTRKLIRCVSSISLADGTIVAEGSATHFVVEMEKQAENGN